MNAGQVINVLTMSAKLIASQIEGALLNSVLCYNFPLILKL